MKKFNMLLFITFLCISILLIIPIFKTKVEMSGWYTYRKVGDFIEVTGYGNVVTNNKYMVKSATVKATILDEDDQVIKVIEYKMKKSGIEFYNYFASEYNPNRMYIEISDVQYDYIVDLIISIVSFIYAIYLSPLFHKYHKLNKKTSRVECINN